MIFNYFNRYNIALVISLGIHIAIIAFIALQTGRALPIIEGTNVITLSLGGPVGSAEGAGHVKKEQSQSSSSSREVGTTVTQSQKNTLTEMSEDIQPKTSQAENSQFNNTIENIDTVENQALAKEDLLDSPYVTPKKPIEKPLKTSLSRPKEKPIVDKKPSLANIKSDKKQIKKQEKLLTNSAQQNNQNTSNEEKQEDSKESKKENVSMKPNINSIESTGTDSSTEKMATTGVGSGKEALSGNDQFVANGDGSYTALGSGGINYKILKDAEPKYPKKARSLGYSKIVKVQVRLIVELDGHVVSVEILNDNIPELGFKEEAVAAIKSMTFEPIVYKQQPIKMYFKKTVVFQY